MKNIKFRVIMNVSPKGVCIDDGAYFEEIVTTYFELNEEFLISPFTVHDWTEENGWNLEEILAISQYIRRNDRHDEEIFEHDIIRRYTSNGEIEWGYILWNDLTITMRRVITTEVNNQFEWIEWPDDYFDDCEVIGNIIKLPEFLKIEKN